jgi:hypothetical protein
MKILFYFFSICILCSCKKNYSCECITTLSMTPVYYMGELEMEGQSYDQSATININDRKKKAETRCKSNESTVTQNGYYTGSGYSGGDITSKTECNIK